jgi:Gti1/Pac2 family transcription factor
METYNGLVRTPTDAIILFEACRMGILPRVQRRLSEKERQSIRSGSVFVWDEREAGMRRWTDGKSWSASRVSGSFLTYREMEGKRGGTSGGNGGGNSYANASPANRATKTPENGADDAQAGDGEEGPDGYRYKPDGLMKQSFSITTSTGQHLHLISYYSRSHPTAQVLRQPSTDPSLTHITPAKGMYPESTINDQSTVPAVTRSPMVGAPGYVMTPGAPGYHRPGPASPPAYLPPGYIPHHAAYIYPISPMHTPPPGYHLQPYPMHHGLPPLAYGAAPYPSPHAIPISQAPPSSYDQRPLRNSESRSSVPPPPPSTGPIAPASYSLLSPSAPYHPPAPAPVAQDQQQAQQQQQQQSAEAPPSGPQIDPRLTTNASESSDPQVANNAEDPKPVPRHSSDVSATPSQAPTITSLVHNIDTKLANANGDKPGDSEADRQGSTSPGGTKNGAPPQDIPSEKLGFREDKRALSKLDRVFAKV